MKPPRLKRRQRAGKKLLLHVSISTKYNGLQKTSISASRSAGDWTNLARHLLCTARVHIKHISEFCHEDRQLENRCTARGKPCAAAVAAGQRLIAGIKSRQAATVPLNEQFLAMSRSNREEAVNFLLKQASPANTAWLNSIDEFIELQEAKSRQDELEAEDAFQAALWRMLVLAVVALALGAAVAWLITRSITPPSRRRSSWRAQSPPATCAARSPSRPKTRPVSCCWRCRT
jgi:hypothetical protein